MAKRSSHEILPSDFVSVEMMPEPSQQPTQRQMTQPRIQSQISRIAPNGSDVATGHALCTNLNGGPAYPLYHLIESRVASFLHWPRALRQRPEQLACAGFFYYGLGDRVACYMCGGGLANWTEGDIPIEQHARNFPQCRVMRRLHEQANRKLATFRASATPAPYGASAQPKYPACQTCSARAPPVVFEPCQHIVACVQCGPAFKLCPACNVRLDATIRL